MRIKILQLNWWNGSCITVAHLTVLKQFTFALPLCHASVVCRTRGNSAKLLLSVKQGATGAALITYWWALQMLLLLRSDKTEQTEALSTFHSDSTGLALLSEMHSKWVWTNLAAVIQYSGLMLLSIGLTISRYQKTSQFCFPLFTNVYSIRESFCFPLFTNADSNSCFL